MLKAKKGSKFVPLVVAEGPSDIPPLTDDEAQKSTRRKKR